MKYGANGPRALPSSVCNIEREQARKPESQLAGFQLFITIGEALGFGHVSTTDSAASPAESHRIPEL